MSTITQSRGGCTKTSVVADGSECVDRKGVLLTLTLLPKSTRVDAKIFRKQRECQWCSVTCNKRAHTSYMCGSCLKPFCVPSTMNNHCYCFNEHVMSCGPYEKIVWTVANRGESQNGQEPATNAPRRGRRRRF